MTERRGRPYTEIQLSKCKCFVCGAPAKFQWNACADGNIWRPLCELHDVLVNTAVLKVLYPQGWGRKLKAYCREIRFPYPFEERPNEQDKRRKGRKSE